MKELPDHWPLGPSSASRWLKCIGSAGAHSESSKAADRGTLGHVIAEQLLRGKKELTLTMAQGELFNSLDAEQRMVLIDAINVCVQYVRSVIVDYVRNECFVCLLETKIASELLPHLHGGTIDVILATDTTLHVIDFKFGYVAVEAEGNKQLQSYLNLAAQQFPGRTVNLGTIVQPSYRGPDTAEFTQEQLTEHAEAVRVAARKFVDHRHDERVAGVEQCKYCPLLRDCPEAATLMVDSVKEFPDLVQFASTIQTNGPTPEQVAQVERFHMIHQLAKNAYDASASLLKQWAKAGKELTHHRVTKVTRTYWKRDARAELVDQGHEPEDFQVGTEPALKTPAQTRATLGMEKDQFADAFRSVLEFRDTPTLKQKMKPALDELAEFDTPLPPPPKPKKRGRKKVKKAT